MKENRQSRISRVLAVLLLLVMVVSCVICTPIIEASAATGGGEGTWVEGNPQKVTSKWSYYRAGVDSTYSDYLYYDIYLPAGYDENDTTKEYSLLLFLHGSLYAQSSQYAFARFLKFNAVADANDIIVIYPRQSINLNFTHSWNFWADTDQCRTSGYTPDAMVSYVKKAINTYNIKEGNVFTAGFSAGGAYSIALLSMYPDVFSAACSSSGLPFKTTGAALDAVAAMYDTTSWGGYETNTTTLAGYVNTAFKTAGVSESRRLMVMHGTADSLVVYANGERSAETWVKAMQKYDSSLSLTPTVTETYTSAGGATYDMELYGGTTPETSTVAFYTVQGMDHAWSGSTAGTTSYGFALGPSTNELMWRFFTGSYNQPKESADEVTGSSEATLPQTAISGSFNYGSGTKISNISTSTTFDLKYANYSPDYYTMYQDPYYSAYFCYDLKAIMNSLPEVPENYVREIQTITVSANVSKGDDANGYVSNAIIYFQTTNSAWTGTSGFPKSGYKVGDGTYGSDWTSCGNIKFDIWAEDLGTGDYLTLKLAYEFGVWVMFPSYMTMTSDIPTITINYVDTYVEPIDPIQSVEYEIDEDKKLSFKVVTVDPYTEVKLMDSVDTSVTLASSSSYTVNADGNYEFTMTIDAPSELTMYYIDCGSNGVYLEQYYSCIVEGPEIEEPIAEPAIKSVSHELVGNEVVFTVVTNAAAIDRAKVSLASDTSKYLAYTSDYVVDANGDYVWTITDDAPAATTEYAFDIRNSDTGYYTREYFNYTVEVEVAEPAIKSVTPSVENGKVVFTVVTKSGNYNRLRVGPNTTTVGNLAIASKYTVDANGDYVWKVSIDMPSKSTNLYFDLRDASTGKFIGDCYHYYLDIANLDLGGKIDSVSTEVVKDKLVFTVVTSNDVNRVKVALASDPTSYIKYASKYTLDANGNYVWTISIDEPSETTDYVLDARDSATNKYTRVYYNYTYNYDASASNKSILSVSHKIAGKDLVFEVVTKPVTNRVKVSLTSDLSTYLDYTNDYSVDVNGNYVWTLTVKAPSAVTSYSFDSRNPETSKYYKDYFEYTVDPSQSSTIPSDNSVIKYVTHTIVNGKVEFVVTTAASESLNRVKVNNADGDLLAYTSKYTVAENGDYVWNLSVDAPESATSYTFDARSAETNAYLKLAYVYALSEEDLKATNTYLTPYVKSVDTELFSASNNTEKLVFTVVTTSEVNRVKVAYANEPTSYIAYTSKYTVDGDSYVWTISIDAPLYSTAFALDVRVGTTYKRDYVGYDYIVEAVNSKYWNTVDVNGVYTFSNGGVQIDANGWLLYDQYGITLVASNGYPTSCASISIYEPDDATVFENKTVAEFEAVLGTEISSLEKTTIGDGYTCYIAKSADGAYFTYVFQTEFNKYFVNFIQAADGVDVASVSEAIMDSIVIFY